MDIDRVRYFHIFAETGSLVAASEVLHISQPALSKALKVLEQEIGAKLIEADGRGLKLTKMGLAFKRETSGLLTEWMAVPGRLTKNPEIAPTKIGSFEVFTTYFLAALTKYIELENLELHEFGPGKLEQAVSDGIIDIGITYIPIPKPQLEFVEVNKVCMEIYGTRKFKNQPLGELPFIIPLHPIEGTPSKVIGLDGWPDHKYPRQIKYRVTMMESAIELCRLGLGVAYLPRFVVELHNKNVIPELRLYPHDSPLREGEKKQSVFLMTRKNQKESKLYRQVAKCLRSLS